VPVWLHRQAGRYLPEFREVRAKHGFFHVCRTPSLACEVTVQPIDRFPDLDCSIIFSDILVVLQALGLEVLMKEAEGPVLPEPVRTLADMPRVAEKVDVDAALSYVYDAICVTRHALGGRVPLIGFVGAPWTLFSYMTDGRGSKTYQHSLTWLYNYPAESHVLLQRITDVCVDFLIGQAKAGAQMLQVFESHAGELSPELFKEFALPYLAQIAGRVKAGLRAAGITSQVAEHAVLDESAPAIADDSIPITCFPRRAAWALPWLAATQYDTFSVDNILLPAEVRRAVSHPRVLDNPVVKAHLRAGIDADTGAVDAARTPSVTLQGNLDPGALFAPDAVIARLTREMVADFGTRRYIANLGHGMLPTHEPRAVAAYAAAVHEASKDLISKL